ncbi:putative transposase [Pseudoduganella flava]|uniref:Putative transposase n=1 Tax=Pseudoduganella flava TaxID=871742 RepID=A0A562PSU2_9BURK|nr:transposase [Pseudoduganella flava]TWI47479.1 putative transposase [Pseudoduganella flava]
MARPKRVFLPGVPLHIVDRGNARQRCFFDDRDRVHYLDHLRTAAAEKRCAVHAYVLMTNHVHLLVTPEVPDGVPAMMKSIAQCHAQYINWRYRRTGGLWEGRYKAAHIESETYLLICQRYIELNPLRAKMVEFPGQYRWSSYRRNADGRPDPLVTQHELYRSLGVDGAARCGHYRDLFAQPLSTKDVAFIRAATNAEFAVGGQAFLKRIAGLRDGACGPAR